MKRRFPDYLKAYLAYANDDWIPPQFNQWAALSTIAGALERRVWLQWNDTFAYYPNVYVLLVSMPGDGKSVALNKAVDILKEVNGRTNTLNIMPNQVTEAKFIELMGHGRTFIDSSSGKELITVQNAGYYYASEASNSLKNIFGDFIACLTDFYDCPTTWERATKKDGKKIRLQNVCMNLLAGSTHDYLGKLVNDENIMGGFASRLIYVESKNKEVKAQAFGGADPNEASERAEYRNALVDDLSAIAKLTGPMLATPEFAKAWERWYPEYETKRRTLTSERAQSILARANTNILKLSMLLSASESDDRMLRMQHWERAHDLIMGLQEVTPEIFRKARANSSQKSNDNLIHAIFSKIAENPGITELALKNSMVFQYEERIVAQKLNALLQSKYLVLGETTPTGRKIEILGNPDDHF